MAMLFPQICIIASFLISVLALPFHDESGRMAQADYGLDEYIRRYYLSSAERSGAVGLAGYMVGTTWVYMQVYDAILEKQNPNHRYRKCISKRFGTDLPGWVRLPTASDLQITLLHRANLALFGRQTVQDQNERLARPAEAMQEISSGKHPDRIVRHRRVG